MTTLPPRTAHVPREPRAPKPGEAPVPSQAQEPESPDIVRESSIPAPMPSFASSAGLTPHAEGGSGIVRSSRSGPPGAETGPMSRRGPAEHHGVKSVRETVIARAAQVKQSCRIEDVIFRYGVQLAPAGGGHRLSGICPFHAEEHPSFTVYPDTQSFCCYGCHAAGDVITFVCLIEQVRFNEALKLLGEPQDPESLSGSTGRSITSLASPETRSRPIALSTSPPTAQAVALRSVCLNQQLEASAEQPADGKESLQRIQPVLRPVREGRLGEHQDGADETPNALCLTLLSITTALAMQGLVHAPSALAYLGERGISLALARRCRLGYLHDAALLDYVAGDEHLQRAAQQVGLLNRLRRGTLARRLIVPEIREGHAIQLIGRLLPGAHTLLPHVKYYLVCGTGEKGLLGYGAALERLAYSRQDAPTRDAPRSIHQAQSPVRQYTPIPAPRPRGILVLEGAVDYVVAVGWDLPVLPVALLSAYPSRVQLGELLDLQARSGGLPFLLMQDADSAGQEAAAHLAHRLTERHVSFDVLSPLPHIPGETPHYKDLGELGPLGRAGRALALTGIEQALERLGHGGVAR